jgi:transglutaminase-like putative cysteine protease
MKISSLFIALLALGTAAPMTGNTFHPELIRGTDDFEVVYRIVLPEIHKPGTLWVPFAKSDSHQQIRASSVSSPLSWRQIQDRDYGNQILLFSPGAEHSGKVIEVKYTVRRMEKPVYRSDDPDPLRHLRPERLVPINETFRSLARQATLGKTTDFERGRALYHHVLERMNYDKSGTGWGLGDAVYACDARSGNCTDFHAYFIALARSVGIPARFAIGMTIPARTNEGPISGYHCWAEFHADGKWVPVDISEASRFPELAGYYFGHHPANRFELSTGRDIVVHPSPASGPMNFLVYPLLEVDGKMVLIESKFRFRRLDN